MTNQKPSVYPNGRYSIKETAQVLDISTSSIYRYIRDGIIPICMRRNGRPCIEGKEITRFWGGDYL